MPSFGVSHELRTLLTSINGSISLPLNGVSDGFSESALRMLTIARQNCKRLILMVNWILDLGGPKGGPRNLLLAADLSEQLRLSIQVNYPCAERFDMT